MRNCNLRALRHSDPNAAGLQDITVTPHSNYRSRFAAALIVDLVSDGLRLTDNPEARRGDEPDPAVAFILAPGDEGVNRSGKAKRARVRGHVMHAAVRNHDGAGDAIGRYVGKRCAKRGE